jgi:hypothetical protein
MMIFGLTLAAMIVLYPQTGSDPSPHCPPTKGDAMSDLSPVMGFVRCKSTKAEVQARLGKPHSELVEDRTTTDFYSFPNGSAATILFDKDGLLLRTLIYAEPSPNSK